jgi:photosystem II stability/assembly factor-like uncharacterized protein
LSTSKGNLSPAFNPSTSLYTVTVPFSDIEVALTAVPRSSGATLVQVPPNPIALDVGVLQVAITVTAGDGVSKKVYGVAMTRLPDEQWQPLADPTYFSTFVVDPVEPDRIYAGYYNGIHKSVDRGLSWTEIELFTADQVRDMEIDPLNRDTVYIGVTAQGTGGTGVFRSDNRASTWDQVLADASVSTLAVDPVTPTILYAGTVGGTFAGDAQGIVKSEDRGANWSASNLGLESLEILDIQLNPLNPRVLYASTAGGLHKSEDGGGTWFRYDNGLPNGAIVQIVAIDPRNPAMVFAATIGDGVFRSTDGGANWQSSNSGIPSLTSDSLVINPLVTSYVYAGTEQAVFRSIDAGLTWSEIPSDGVFWTGDVGSLGISPADPSTLYALFSRGTTGARIHSRKEWLPQ